MGWSLETHPRLSLVIGTAIYESSDGAVWFGGLGGNPDQGQLGGVLRFDGKTWTHYRPQDGALTTVYGIGQTADGVLWFGGYKGLRCFNGQAWRKASAPEELTTPSIDQVYAAARGDLWIGHRTFGAFHYDRGTWSRYDFRDGLPGNRIAAILQTDDGSIWIGTRDGISRFDHQRWTRFLVDLPSIAWDGLRQSRDGAIWINLQSYWGAADRTFRTVRYERDTSFPETEITGWLDEVPQPGSISLVWAGVDSWHSTPKGELQYAYRLDGGDWSPFSGETQKSFFRLPSGHHRFEVKARDLDFNEDLTPALVRFTVLPPVWQQPWLLGLMAVAIAIIGIQASRVVSRDRRLQASNEALRNEVAERVRVENERAKLDTQLQQLRYLYRLRSALEGARPAGEVIRKAGELMQEVLSALPSAGALIQHDGHVWRFGAPEKGAQIRYERPLAWGGKERGRLALFSSVALDETQERALLDETAADVAGALEARELEMSLLQSSRLVSLGEMAAGVAHELNQPLDVISMVAEDVYLRLTEGVSLPQEELTSMMRDELAMVERMSETIEHLRIFPRDTSGEPDVRFDVNETIHASLKLIEAQLKNHGIALSLNLDEHLPPVFGHPHQMEHVLLNLLTNARDALDEKAAQMDEQRERRLQIRTRYEAEGKRPVVIEVEDNGIGIKEADLPRVFEPFFTTKAADHGTGLGLSISYAIVQNHQGEIACESQGGKATLFQVRLPAVEEV